MKNRFKRSITQLQILFDIINIDVIYFSFSNVKRHILVKHSLNKTTGLKVSSNCLKCSRFIFKHI